MSLVLLIIILTAAVFLEGFFSGSEMAVVSSDKYRLAMSTASGSRRARTALHLVKHPARFFSTTLLGTNICTVAATTVATLFIIDRFGADNAPFALLLWPVLLIVGELVPKSLCQYYADRLVLIVSPIIFAISFLLFPFVWVLSQLTDLLLSGLKRRVGAEPLLSREELELMLEVSAGGESDVKPMERRFISRIFDLAEKKVENIKTPLVDVVALPVGASREDAVHLMEEHGFSRVLVYERRVINIIGVLTNVDLLLGSGMSVRELMHAPYCVPGEMRLDTLLMSMKRRGEQLAVVVDEYGASTGIVTVEDLLEEVVGEIRDEHDIIQSLYERLGPRRYLISGRMEVAAANERLGLNIPQAHGYDTVAGFVIHLAERIPREGEVLRTKELHLIIRRATERSVQEVEIIAKPSSLEDE